MKKRLFQVALIATLVLGAIGMAGPQTALASTAHTVWSPVMQYGPNGWAGWSCPIGEIVLGGGVSSSNTKISAPSDPIQVSMPWKPGEQTGQFTYPQTPFGYTYGAGEQGWIAQNGNTGQNVYIYVYCQPPTQPKKSPTWNCGDRFNKVATLKSGFWEWYTMHGRGYRCNSQEFPGGWKMGDGHRAWFNPQWAKADR